MHAQGGPGRAKPWLSYKVPGTLHTGHANRTGWAVSMGREERREDHLLSLSLPLLSFGNSAAYNLPWWAPIAAHYSQY